MSFCMLSCRCPTRHMLPCPSSRGPAAFRLHELFMVEARGGSLGAGRLSINDEMDLQVQLTGGGSGIA